MIDRNEIVFIGLRTAETISKRIKLFLLYYPYIKEQQENQLSIALAVES